MQDCGAGLANNNAQACSTIYNRQVSTVPIINPIECTGAVEISPAIDRRRSDGDQRSGAAMVCTALEIMGKALAGNFAGPPGGVPFFHATRPPFPAPYTSGGGLNNHRHMSSVGHGALTPFERSVVAPNGLDTASLPEPLDTVGHRVGEVGLMAVAATFWTAVTTPLATSISQRLPHFLQRSKTVPKIPDPLFRKPPPQFFK